jgi:hypothetical protein
MFATHVKLSSAVLSTLPTPPKRGVTPQAPRRRRRNPVYSSGWTVGIRTSSDKLVQPSQSTLGTFEHPSASHFFSILYPERTVVTGILSSLYILKKNHEEVFRVILSWKSLL